VLPLWPRPGQGTVGTIQHEPPDMARLFLCHGDYSQQSSGDERLKVSFGDGDFRPEPSRSNAVRARPEGEGGGLRDGIYGPPVPITQRDIAPGALPFPVWFRTGSDREGEGAENLLHLPHGESSRFPSLTDWGGRPVTFVPAIPYSAAHRIRGPSIVCEYETHCASNAIQQLNSEVIVEVANAELLIKTGWAN